MHVKIGGEVGELFHVCDDNKFVRAHEKVTFAIVPCVEIFCVSIQNSLHVMRCSAVLHFLNNEMKMVAQKGERNEFKIA